jgi:hypothetical protein
MVTHSEVGWLRRTNSEENLLEETTPSTLVGIVLITCAADVPPLFASHQLPTSDAAFLRAKWPAPIKAYCAGSANSSQ